MPPPVPEQVKTDIRLFGTECEKPSALSIARFAVQEALNGRRSLFSVPGIDRARTEERLTSDQHICSFWPHGNNLSTVLPRRFGEMWPEHLSKSALPDGQHDERTLDI